MPQFLSLLAYPHHICEICEFRYPTSLFEFDRTILFLFTCGFTELMITKQNLLYSTFIDLEVEIINSSQRKLIGQKGIVVDETKNLIVIENTDKKCIKIPKVSSVFRFKLDNGQFTDVKGRAVAFRPHERPKKV